MALRNICKIEKDDILRKKCREVKVVDDRVRELLSDMAETMYFEKGVGLAAPQVGMLKRIIVVDTGDGIINFINPEIVEKSGTQEDEEGCLSIPDRRAMVIRPMKVTVKGLDEMGNEKEITAEGFKARALCHEIDHLDGILFIDRAQEV